MDFPGLDFLKPDFLEFFFLVCLRFVLRVICKILLIGKCDFHHFDGYNFKIFSKYKRKGPFSGAFIFQRSFSFEA